VTYGNAFQRPPKDQVELIYVRPCLVLFLFRAGVPNLRYICLSEGVHLRLAVGGQNIFMYYLFRNIYAYIFETTNQLWDIKTETIFILQTSKSSIKNSVDFCYFLSSFVIRNSWVHAHLSKFWRYTWSEKGWEPLVKRQHTYLRSLLIARYFEFS